MGWGGDALLGFADKPKEYFTSLASASGYGGLRMHGLDARRCVICRRFIERNDEVMYSEGFGKEVIFHASCSDERLVSGADLMEWLGMSVSYCVAEEIGIG